MAPFHGILVFLVVLLVSSFGEDQICTKFQINYLQCQNEPNNNISCTNNILRNYTSILSFEPGANLSTQFNITLQNLTYFNGSNYTVGIKFSIGNPNFNVFVDCEPFGNGICQANVPFISSLILDINDETGTQIFHQNSLNFLNGQALLLDSEGNFVYWGTKNTLGMENCLDPTVDNVFNVTNQITYCCLDSSPVTPTINDATETCQEFDAVINLIDKNQNHLLGLSLTLDTSFDFETENFDFRTIYVNGNKSVGSIGNNDVNISLSINSVDECAVTNVFESCSPPVQPSKYYTIIDINYLNKANNVSLYSTTSIVLNKFQHFYYKPDGKAYTRTNDCFSTVVDAYDYFGSGLGSVGSAVSEICCSQWIEVSTEYSSTNVGHTTPKTVQNTTTSAQTTTQAAQNTTTSVQTTTQAAQNTTTSVQTTTQAAQNTTTSVQTTTQAAQNTTTQAAQNTTTSVQTTTQAAQNTTTSAQTTTTPQPTTTSGVFTTTHTFINQNPPEIDTPSTFNIIYIKTNDSNLDNIMSNTTIFAYANINLHVIPGPNSTTTFTVSLQAAPFVLNITDAFNVSIRFSVGLPIYANNFIDYYFCNLTNIPCTVNVPYLSTVYLDVNTVNGTTQYHQQALGFYNGNALNLNKEGDYITDDMYTAMFWTQPCLPSTFQEDSNGFYTSVYYCTDRLDFSQVPIPNDFALETCKSFNGEISIFSQNNDQLASVNFDVSNSFNLGIPNLDYRNVSILNYNVFADPNANAILYANMDEDCRLSPNTSQCEANVNTTNFLNFDFSFNSTTKNLSLFTSTAIPIYKFWHVFYRSDGKRFVPNGGSCVTGKVDVLDYYASVNGQANKGAYASTNICCTSFVNLTEIHYPPTTSTKLNPPTQTSLATTTQKTTQTSTGTTATPSSISQTSATATSSVSTTQGTPTTTGSTLTASSTTHTFPTSQTHTVTTSSVATTSIATTTTPPTTSKPTTNPENTTLACSRFALSYSQYENLNDQNSMSTDYPTRNWTATLDFNSGANLATVFTISNQMLNYHTDTYAFNVTIKFASGKPSLADNFNEYIPCTENSPGNCSATVPYLANLYIYINDASGTGKFVQYPLSFYNGKALFVDDQGDYVYWGMTNTAGLYNCLQPTVIQDPLHELYSQLTYCCLDSVPLYPSAVPAQICKTFDGSLNLLDHSQTQKANINFTLDTMFSGYTQNIDSRTITINSYSPAIITGQNQLELEVNAEQDCHITNISQTCYANNPTNYYIFLDINYFDKNANLSLYSSTAIFLNKLEHVYYMADGTRFDANSSTTCYTNTVTAYDYFGGGTNTAGSVQAKICCSEFIPWLQITTSRPETTPQQTTPAAPTTTQPFINPNPPEINTPTTFNVIYLLTDGWNITDDEPGPSSIYLRYLNVFLRISSSPLYTTTFNVNVQHQNSTNNTYAFTVGIKFGVGIPSYANNFDDYYNCDLTNGSCTVTVPYLSSIYLLITDANGTQQYHQPGLGFYNGNALNLNTEGDYITDDMYTASFWPLSCLPNTLIQDPNDIYTSIFYCTDRLELIQVPIPTDFAFETCQTFAGGINIFDKAQLELASVNFQLDNSFNLGIPNLDYRNVSIISYDITVDQSANAFLHSNTGDDCKLSSTNSRCDVHTNNTNFLNFDFSFDSPTKNLSLYTSTAISLYKFWHVFYNPDGSRYKQNGPNCFNQVVKTLDYYASVNGQVNKGAYATSNICCNKIINITGIPPYTRPTTIHSTTQSSNTPPSTQTQTTATQGSTISTTQGSTQTRNATSATSPTQTQTTATRGSTQTGVTTTSPPGSTTTPFVTTTPIPTTKNPENTNLMCSKFALSYYQCENLNQQNFSCTDLPTRNWTATLDFNSGANLATVFTISNQMLNYHTDTYAFNVTIKFASGKPSLADNFNEYISCTENSPGNCSATVPYLANLYIYINDASGTGKFVQYPLSFYNGKALFVDDQGDYVYWGMANTAGAYNCLQPSVINDPQHELYSQLSYCCLESSQIEPATTQAPSQAETCKTFTGTLNLFDHTQTKLADISFTLNNTFNGWSQNIDSRTIIINSYDPPITDQNQLELEVNAEQDCHITGITQQCYPNQLNNYYTILDINYSDKTSNVSLYSSTALFLNKYEHVYYMADGTLFDNSTNTCYSNTVMAYDYFGGQNNTAGSIQARICCSEFILLTQIASGGTEPPTVQTTTVGSTTTQSINPNPPDINTPIDFNIIYLLTEGWNETTEEGDQILRYLNAYVRFSPGPGYTTTFVVNILHQDSLDTYNFTAGIKFGVGIPSYVNDFDDYYNCDLTNGSCTVNIPYLSTIYLFITDGNGTQQYRQPGLGFLNGNAIDLNREGDYINEHMFTAHYLLQFCLPNTLIHDPNNTYTNIFYCTDLFDFINVPIPNDFAFETCQVFDAGISMFSRDTVELGTINFYVNSSFNLAIPNLDYRSTNIYNYALTVDPNATAFLYSNMDDDCRVTSQSQICDTNANTTNFLYFDFSIQSPTKNISLFTSAAISLYKFWHVYYKADGTRYDSPRCFELLGLEVFDYYSTVNNQTYKGAYANSNVCCTQLVNITGIPYRPPTTISTTTLTPPTITTTIISTTQGSTHTGTTTTGTTATGTTASTPTQTATTATTQIVTTTTPPSVTTTAQNLKNELCGQLVINYQQCDNYDKVKNYCNGTMLRNYFAVLSYEKGANSTTSFTITQKSLSIAYPNNTFNITIRFGVGKVYYANNLDIYYDCPFANNVCQAQVPYISTLYLYVNDANGTQQFVQFPLSFYNGDALYLDDNGDYLYSTPIGGTGNCMQPTAIEGPNNIYSQVSYCCNKFDSLPTAIPSSYGSCRTFNANITVLDKQNAYLASVNFNVTTTFDTSTENTDLRSIYVNAFDIPPDFSNAYLEINAQDDCNLKSNNNECNLNDQSKYYLFLDFNLFSQSKNTSSYSTTAVALYKWSHVYYKQDGTVFAPGVNCSSEQVNSYDYFGSGISGIASSTICCLEFETLAPPTTQTPPQTAPTATSVQTTTQKIDTNPPNTPICTQLSMVYIQCYDFNLTTNACGQAPFRYYEAVINYNPGDNIQTNFSIITASNYTSSPFNGSIKFGVGKTSFVDNFNDFYDCDVTNQQCQVAVPYLSSMYLFINDENGTIHRYNQPGLSFYHGNALDIGSTGDYLNPYGNFSWQNLNNCLRPTQISDPNNNLYTQIIYCCSNIATVPPPQLYAFESCQNFNADIEIHDKTTNTTLATVNFNVSSAFDLSSSDTDFRSIIINSYSLPVDNSSLAFLEVDMDSDCRLATANQQCDINKPSSYFLNLDLHFNSQSKNISYYSSTALSLYKYWHAYYMPDGTMFSNAASCYGRTVDALNYYGTQNGQAAAISTICCTNFVPIDIPHSTATVNGGSTSTSTSSQTSQTPGGTQSPQTVTSSATTASNQTIPTSTGTSGSTQSSATSTITAYTLPASTQIPYQADMCNQFSISYFQCFDFNRQTGVCQGDILRAYNATLQFTPGSNFTTMFNVTTTNSAYAGLNYAFNPEFKFYIGKPGSSSDFDFYYNCLRTNNEDPSCTSTVPYLSTLFFYVQGNNGTSQKFVQYPLSFFNGKALDVSSDGAFMYPIQSATTNGLNYCMTPNAVDEPDGSYSQVVYCCTGSEVMPTRASMQETCSSFDATITIYDTLDDQPEVRFTLNTDFNISNANSFDRRNVTVTLIDLPMTATSSWLEINAGYKCQLNSSNTQCETNQKTIDWLIFDFNFLQPNLTTFLHSTTAIAIYKYQHMYYKPDGTPFTQDSSCYTRNVSTLDWYQGTKWNDGSGSTATGNICCTNWASLYPTTTPSSTASQTQSQTTTLATTSTTTTTPSPTTESTKKGSMSIRSDVIPILISLMSILFVYSKL